jgi:hypothetical protein
MATQDEEEDPYSLAGVLEEPSDAVVNGSLYLCEGTGNDGLEQCRFIALCSEAEEEDDLGVFWQGEFVATSCPYWQFWMSSPGAEGCVGAPFIFHSCSFRGCDAPYSDDSFEVVHVPYWEVIETEAAMSIVVDWHAREPEITWPSWLFGDRPADLEARWHGGGPHPPIRAPAAGRGQRLAPPVRMAGSAANLRAAVAQRAAPGGLAAATGAAPTSKAAGKRERPVERSAGAPGGVGLALARAAEAGLGPQGRRASGEAARSTRSPPVLRGGPMPTRGDPDRGVWREGDAVSVGDSEAASPKRARSEPGAGEGRLADVLAQRARARIAASAAARTAEQTPSADAAVKLLLRALQSPGGQGESDGLGLGVGGSSSGDGIVPAGVASKRTHFRRLASEHPGRLFRSGLSSMEEQLSPLDGADGGAEVPAVALKYLLTVYTPQNPVRAVGLDMFRQLRTLAECMDLLVQGKTPQALDMLMQRFKACQMAVADKRWDAARWLELIPPSEGQNVVSAADEELTGQISLADLRLQKLRAELAVG